MMCNDCWLSKNGINVMSEISYAGLSPEETQLFSEYKAEVEGMIDIIKNILKKDEINLNAHFVHDLKCDSLDQAEIMMDIESKYSVTVDDKLLDKMLHVKDAIREALVLIKQKAQV